MINKNGTLRGWGERKVPSIRKSGFDTKIIAILHSYSNLGYLLGR
jgi:hypothetical protein